MWNKPKEITKYKYRGYELSYYQDEVINVNDVAYIWKTTPAASDMLLCKGKYKNYTWKAMGIGIDDHYVCVWFGQSKDIYGEPKSCKDGYSGSLVLNDIKKIHKDPNVVKEDKTKQNIRTTPQITDNQITATGKIKSTTESSINKNQTRFHIIVGSFGSLKNAEIGKKQIENKNNSCKVIVIKAENRYRLSLENYATKEEANARKVKLAADFPGCWVFEK
jgi:Sporulation related domain.